VPVRDALPTPPHDLVRDVWDIAFSPDGNTIAIAITNGNVAYLWNITTKTTSTPHRPESFGHPVVGIRTRRQDPRGRGHQRNHLPPATSRGGLRGARRSMPRGGCAGRPGLARAGRGDGERQAHKQRRLKEVV
jgi:hypothetical protein